MINISVIVNGSTAVAHCSDKLTSGMVGVIVNLDYDDSWDGFTKNVTFKVGDFLRTRRNAGSSTTVPWEVMRKYGLPLEIGVEVVSQSGNIVVPTIWATVSKIYEGATTGVSGAPNPDSEEHPSGGAAIDDTQISSLTTWSSKKTVDALCPAFEESGAIVTCGPVEGYPLSVAADAEATAITRCGKNLINYTATSKKTYGVTFTVNEDKTITVNGTATGTIYFTVGTAKLVSGVEYRISGCPAGGNGGTYYVYHGSKSSSMDTGSGKTITASETTTGSVYFYMNRGTTLNNAVIKPMLRQADTDSAYEPPKTVETFNPGEPIPALPGVNTIFADVGEVTVTGRTDPTAIINKLTNAIVALGGNI